MSLTITLFTDFNDAKFCVNADTSSKSKIYYAQSIS